MNLSAVIESIITDVTVAVVLFFGALILTWMFGPVKWLRENRKLRKIVLSGRKFHFFYRPTEDLFKPVTFLSNGDIGEGRNSNEHTWKIRKGALEIFHQDRKIYSRFRFDPDSGRLKHTNEADCGRSVFGQYIEPMFKV
ncbi:MAG: hypothetical protein Q7U82_01575 [Gammaproteobacteria bacterium]|nr:hypothetical protein [Gammaproteobacteria bacterium]